LLIKNGLDGSALCYESASAASTPSVRVAVPEMGGVRRLVTGTAARFGAADPTGDG
jgi:hypothetical protein